MRLRAEASTLYPTPLRRWLLLPEVGSPPPDCHFEPPSLGACVHYSIVSSHLLHSPTAAAPPLRDLLLPLAAARCQTSRFRHPHLPPSPSAPAPPPRYPGMRLQPLAAGVRP